jgi:hypothetical protein
MAELAQRAAASVRHREPAPQPSAARHESLERRAAAQPAAAHAALLNARAAGPQPVQRVAPPNGNGLPDRLKTGVEALSGLAMDDVRVHRNSAKPARLGALAYTQGSEIHVAPGQEQHLPHEAWHVVQQKQGRVRPTMQLKAGVALNDDSGLEREADLMAAKAAQGASAPDLAPRSAGSRTSGMIVQRVIRMNGDGSVVDVDLDNLSYEGALELHRNIVEMRVWSTEDDQDMARIMAVLRQGRPAESSSKGSTSTSSPEGDEFKMPNLSKPSPSDKKPSSAKPPAPSSSAPAPKLPPSNVKPSASSSTKQAPASKQSASSAKQPEAKPKQSWSKKKDKSKEVPTSMSSASSLSNSSSSSPPTYKIKHKDMKKAKASKEEEEEYVPTTTSELSKKSQIKEYLDLIDHLAGEGGGKEALKGGHLLSEMKKKHPKLKISGNPDDNAPWEGWWSDGASPAKWSSFFPATWTKAYLIKGLWGSSTATGGRMLFSMFKVSKQGDTFFPWVDQKLKKQPALKDMKPPP